MINLKKHPYDKISHGAITALAVWLFGPAWGFSAVVGFYAREQHTADRYMHGGWRSFFPWLWKWKFDPEGNPNMPTSLDTRWDFYVTVIAYGLMLWAASKEIIKLGVCCG